MPSTCSLVHTEVLGWRVLRLRYKPTVFRLRTQTMQLLTHVEAKQQVTCCSGRPHAHQFACSGSNRPHAHGSRHVKKHWGGPVNKETAVGTLLRSTLAVREQMMHSTLALCPSLVEFGREEVEPNLSLMASLAAPEEVRSLVVRSPGLLAVPLGAWYDFFTALGLHSKQFWRLLRTSPSLLLHGSVYQAGRTILFLRDMGWSDLEINTIVIPHHTAILQVRAACGQQQKGRKLWHTHMHVSVCGVLLPAVNWCMLHKISMDMHGFAREHVRQPEYCSHVLCY